MAAGLAAAVLVAGCGGSGQPPGHPQPQLQPTATATATVVPPVPVSAALFAKLPRSTTYTTIKAAPRDPDPFTVSGGVVVHPQAPLVLYAGPGQRAVGVLPTTELGSPTWVPVVQSSPGWDRVLLPSRPDRATAWVYTGGAAGSRLEARTTAYLILVRLNQRKLTVHDAGRSLGTWTVAVGAAATPTPTGRTFVMASLAPPHPTYSPLILPLGVHSDTLTTFGGGPGTVALHGWPDPSVFGHAISHGCVRVPATALHVLSTIPLGTLVVITQ